MGRMILAYSGGLDSAVILHWLVKLGHDVTTYTAQLGGHPPEFRYQPADNGASDSVIEDLREYWVEDIAAKARRLDAVYGRFLLHVPLGKIPVAEKMALVAKERGIAILAHGAHKGENDFYRLNNYFQHMSGLLNVDFKAYAPWEDETFREQLQDRYGLLGYTNEQCVQSCKVGATTLTSEPTTIGTNYENDELVKFAKPPTGINGYDVPAEKEPFEVTLHFDAGILSQVDSPWGSCKGTLAAVENLDHLGSAMGIGVVDLIEPNIVETKARCLYMQPATSLWHDAHMELGNLVLTNAEIDRRNMISHRAGKLIYFGQWYSNEMQDLIAEVEERKHKYHGWVRFMLYPGFARINSREA